MPARQAGLRNSFFALVPARSAAIFLAAVFFVFAPVNLLVSSSFGLVGSPGAVLLLAVISGAVAVCWAGTFTLSRAFAPGIVFFTVALVLLSGPLGAPVLGIKPSVPSAPGLAVVATTVLGYVCFIVFIDGQGRTTLRLMTEMTLAQRIHAALVPSIERADERLEIDASSFASSEMGGDLVDVVDHGEATDLVLADVSGHGVKAGVVMGMLKSALRMGLRQGQRLEPLAESLNAVIEENTSPEMYATMALLRVHHVDRRVECLLAGHAQALHLRRGSREAAHLGESGFAIGLLAGCQYGSVSAALEPGDLLAVWTDGLDETEDAAGRELGRDAIERSIVERAERPLAEIRQAVYDLVRAHGPQRDDRSLLLVRVR